MAKTRIDRVNERIIEDVNAMLGRMYATLITQHSTQDGVIAVDAVWLQAQFSGMQHEVARVVKNTNTNRKTPVVGERHQSRSYAQWKPLIRQMHDTYPELGYRALADKIEGCGIGTVQKYFKEIGLYVPPVKAVY